MSRVVRRGGSAFAVIAVASLAATITAISADRAGQGARAKAGARRLLGPTRATAEIDVVLELKSRDAALARYVHAVNDPRSPLFRHHLTPMAIGRRFGPPLAAIRGVRRRLEAAALHVSASPARSSLEVRGSVDAINREFRVQLRDYVDPAGARYHVPSVAPTIPRVLRPWVTDVFGLDSRPVSSPADVRDQDFTPHDLALAPDDSALAYDIAPLRRRGVDGRGLTIAIASLSSFPLAHAVKFAKDLGLKGPTPQVRPVLKGVDAKGVVEADLDVDVVRGTAPGARILVYEAPNNVEGVLRLLERILGGPAKIASYSWGRCDSTSNVPRSYRSAVEKRLHKLVAAGITLFVASGDAGAYDCQRNDFADHNLRVDFPSDSPNVVSVGGTLLDVRPNGSYLREAGWENSLTNGGGGGGINPVAAKPKWQAAFGIGGTTRHRVLPDVSASAAPGSQWWVWTTGENGTGYFPVGGTSAAAPFWASSMLLVQQWARDHGGGQLCFAAPLLYQLAYGQRGPPPFHDVVRGGNRYYDARRGWDYATGLGSPDVWNLARAATSYLKKHPCRGTAGGGGKSRGAAHFLNFLMPSRNIACSYFAQSSAGIGGIRCDILSGLVHAPRGCATKWAGVFLPLQGKAAPNCVPDSVYDQGDPTLAYGRSWTKGSITCRSRMTGLTCLNRGGHQFFLARESWRVS